MRYRINEVPISNGWREVKLQVRTRWGWRTFWSRRFPTHDREYALLCAEELFDHLTAEI